MKKAGIAVLLLLVIGAIGFAAAPGLIDRKINRTTQQWDTPAPLMHKDLFIADLHADTLLWQRDLLEQHDYGHVDLPRLQKGNVALQVFSAVTKVPYGQNFQSNTGNSDRVQALAIAQGWPAATWSSPLQRALYQARRLREAAANSNGELRIIQHRGDLFALHFNRLYNPKLVGGLLAIEGAQALEGKVENVDRLYNAGYRMISLSHFFDTEFGGSAHGVDKDGLSANGRQLIARMREKNMLVDIAHASPKLIDDLLAYRMPLFVSHTGVKGTCDSPRNLSDEQLRGIAANGGLVGIAFFPGAVCGSSVNHILNAIHHTVDVAGINAVALGSDYDGAVSVPFHSGDMHVLTRALINDGFSLGEIRQIMGGNVLRVLSEMLPPNPEPELPVNFTF